MAKDPSDSDGRRNLRVRLATAAGILTGAAIGLLLRPDFGGFWQGMLAFAIVLGVGGALGRFVGHRLFRSPSERAPSSRP
jgi:hypothetical protein